MLTMFYSKKLLLFKSYWLIFKIAYLVKAVQRWGFVRIFIIKPLKFRGNKDIDPFKLFKTSVVVCICKIEIIQSTHSGVKRNF